MGLNVFTLLVLGSAVSFTTGGIFMKLSQGLTKPWPTAALLVLFVLGAVLQTLAMRGEDLGVTYIVILGVEAILAFLFGWWLFGEQMTVLKVAAVSLIVVGIVGLRH
jgi:multidrug transporter EmrE-like cation transporter